MADHTSDRSSFLISKETVKICTLCGTLNHADNAECWACCWRGEFGRDERIVALAWQRLESRYEEVRMEHLTAQKRHLLGDFGAPRPRSRWQVLTDGCRTWWQGIQTQRNLRQARRQAGLRSRAPSRPDQLGV